MLNKTTKVLLQGLSHISRLNWHISNKSINQPLNVSITDSIDATIILMKLLFFYLQLLFSLFPFRHGHRDSTLKPDNEGCVTTRSRIWKSRSVNVRTSIFDVRNFQLIHNKFLYHFLLVSYWFPIGFLWVFCKLLMSFLWVPYEFLISSSWVPH